MDLTPSTYFGRPSRVHHLFPTGCIRLCVNDKFTSMHGVEHTHCRKVAGMESSSLPFAPNFVKKKSVYSKAEMGQTNRKRAQSNTCK